MLGASYLISFSLQHGVFLGLAVLLIGEVMIEKNASSSIRAFYKHLCLVGLSIINLSFLHYSFTEELLLVQLLLTALILVAFCTTDRKEVGPHKSDEFGLYIMLSVFLFVELLH